MGRFSVEIDLANVGDMTLARAGHLPAAKVRRVRTRGVVDTGASRLVLPESAALELGLEHTGEVTVRYADGRSAVRPTAGPVYLEYLGRGGYFNAVVEPDRTSALIGAMVMEDLDLIADCRKGALVPRDPKQIISEIE